MSTNKTHFQDCHKKRARMAFGGLIPSHCAWARSYAFEPQSTISAPTNPHPRKDQMKTLTVRLTNEMYHLLEISRSHDQCTREEAILDGIKSYIQLTLGSISDGMRIPFQSEPTLKRFLKLSPTQMDDVLDKEAEKNLEMIRETRTPEIQELTLPFTHEQAKTIERAAASDGMTIQEFGINAIACETKSSLEGASFQNGEWKEDLQEMAPALAEEIYAESFL